jgi:hypothetical protein
VDGGGPALFAAGADPRLDTQLLWGFALGLLRLGLVLI